MPSLTHDEIDERACELRRSAEEAVRQVLLYRGPMPLTALASRARMHVFRDTKVSRNAAWIVFAEIKAQLQIIERAVSRLTYEGDVVCYHCSGPVWRYRLASQTSPEVLEEDGAALARHGV